MVKSSKLERQSTRWLLEDGARHIFQSKGYLIAAYEDSSNVVAVTTPASMTQARKRLERLTLPSGWHRKLHIWPSGWINPVVESVD